MKLAHLFFSDKPDIKWDLCRQMLRNMGRLGITTLCYNFMQTGWFRTSRDIKERGGAYVTGFDMADAAPLPPRSYAPVNAGDVWENYKWFISEVIPTAEESGVRMGLHPDDPPVPVIEGVGRFLYLTDMPAMLALYASEGFDGILRSDHVPTMAGEDNDQPNYSMNGSLSSLSSLILRS